MKGIIFNCIDNFNDTYKFVVVCEEDKVQDTIKEQMSLSTEIVDYEIVNAKIK
jgi:hypothetical protein